MLKFDLMEQTLENRMGNQERIIQAHKTQDADKKNLQKIDEQHESH